MKKTFLFAAFALLATAMTLPITSCGGDDDDDKGGGSKFETQTFTVGGVSFKMMPVEGGSFTMGSPDHDTDADNDEKPQHAVTLSDFYMGETEVTQALWKAVMDGNNPSYFTGDDNLPVEKVSWEDCQTFITKLNGMLKEQLGGKTFRLPTETEWEYAARGGKKLFGYTYAGSGNLDLVAWYSGNSENKTHPVGTKTKNDLGLYDMSGNVWEWCGDWYGEYTSEAQANPTGPATGSLRVYRGGSWGNSAQNCRVSNRDGNTPSSRYLNLGLRLAMSK